MKKAKKINPKKLKKGYQYVRSLAIKGDRVDANGDMYPFEELKKAVSSFIGVPIELGFNGPKVGKVVDATISTKDKSIIVTGEVKKGSFDKGEWLGYNIHAEQCKCLNCGKIFNTLAEKCKCEPDRYEIREVSAVSMGVYPSFMKRA
jgi:hypothetical protein